MKTRILVMSAMVMLFIALVLFTSISEETALGSDPPPWSCDPVSCIPADATINSATLGLYVRDGAGQEVRVHRVTAPWTEMEVTWNNFGGSFDAGFEGSFIAPTSGWVQVDVTSVFLDWAYGFYPNFGLLLEQGLTDFTEYDSSEYSTGEYRPYLEVCYTTSGGYTCAILVRPCATVEDADISEESPDMNGGNSTHLFTGVVNGFEKQTLIRFEFEICDEPTVNIDIKPGSYPNSINPKAGGVIPVAVLTTDIFDASSVDPSTVALEGVLAQEKGKSGKYGSLEDVDGDGDLDLVVQIPNTIDWAEDATEATLTGETWDGIPIEGTDSVNIVPPY